MRYFLVDKVTALVPGESAEGVKNVTLSDDILHDHFPGYPVFPGALMVEAASQLAGFLLEVSQERGDGPVRRALLVQVRKAKFHELTGPGDQLRIRVKLESSLEAAAEVSVEVTAGDRRVMRGDLTFMMKAIDIPAIHEQRKALYALWTRDLNPRPDIL